MRSTSDAALMDAVRESAHPLTGSARDHEALMDVVGDARFALLGEASHGTHEFYRERAEVTKLLITDKGVTAVAVEADWSDAYRVNRYVRGVSDDIDATTALADFRRFPTWMWRNTEIVDFVEWLLAHNDARPGRGSASTVSISTACVPRWRTSMPRSAPALATPASTMSVATPRPTASSPAPAWPERAKSVRQPARRAARASRRLRAT